MAADEMAVFHYGIKAKKLLDSLMDLASNYLIKNSRFPIQVHASQGYFELKQRVIWLSSLSNARDNQASNWIFCIIIGITLISSIAFTWTQQEVLPSWSLEKPADGSICTQIKHEKIIESWLQLKVSSNKCEQ